MLITPPADAPFILGAGFNALCGPHHTLTGSTNTLGSIHTAGGGRLSSIPTTTLPLNLQPLSTPNIPTFTPGGGFISSAHPYGPPSVSTSGLPTYTAGGGLTSSVQPYGPPRDNTPGTATNSAGGEYTSSVAPYQQPPVTPYGASRPPPASGITATTLIPVLSRSESVSARTVRGFF